MCGICGVIQIDGAARQVVAPDVLRRMTDAMAHRGPDDAGFVEAPGVAFGARRLSIVDVEGGHQPFGIQELDVWGMQNGEIFNHAMLREGLERDGFSFRSRCDTEVLPALYARDGLDFPRRLRGMFGIGIWDGRRRRGMIVRDRLGIKPLYHARVGDLLVFASELKCLLASGLVPVDLDYEAIDAYLTLGFVPGPRTPLAAVKRLEPGHMLVVEEGRVWSEAYWRYPTPPVEPVQMSRQEASERLYAELEESVRLRLMSDVPLGAMLSGGLDSSLIVGMMSRMMSEPVKTFSVGLVGEAKDNELADARFVSSVFGTEHHELELELEDGGVDLEQLVWHLDEPLADLSSLGFLGLCELARRHVTVALSGQGADELLGGYRKHRMASLVGSWQRIPRPLRAPGELAARRLGPRLPGSSGRIARALAAPGPAERLLGTSAQIDPALRDQLARGPLAEVPSGSALRAISRHLDGVRAPLPAALHLDGQLGLVDDMLTYFDRASMAHSLEGRCRSSTITSSSSAATIPAELKVGRSLHRLTTKQVLRGCVARPRARPHHRQAEDRLLQLGRRPLVRRPDARRGVRLPARPLRRATPSCWTAQGVEALVAQQLQAPDRRTGHLLLSVLMLEVWLQTYLPRATSAGARAAEPVGICPRPRLAARIVLRPAGTGSAGTPRRPPAEPRPGSVRIRRCAREAAPRAGAAPCARAPRGLRARARARGRARARARVRASRTRSRRGRAGRTG